MDTVRRMTRWQDNRESGSNPWATQYGMFFFAGLLGIDMQGDEESPLGPQTVL